LLNSLVITAGAPGQLYECPAGKLAVVSVNLCNRSGARAKVGIGLKAGGDAVAAADWIEFDTPINPAGSVDGSVLERTGVVLKAGDRLWVSSDVAGVNAHVWGMVEDV